MNRGYTNEELWEQANRRYSSPSPAKPLAILAVLLVIGLCVLSVALLGPSDREVPAGGDPLNNFLMSVGRESTKCYKCEEGTVGTPWNIPDTCWEVVCQ